jgi:hypothetical protein
MVIYTKLKKSISGEDLIIYPEHRYTLNGNTNDDGVGTASTQTINGSLSYVTGHHFTNALSFPGDSLTTNYLSITNFPQSLVNSVSFSSSFWVKINGVHTVGTSIAHHLVGRYPGGSPEWRVRYSEDTNKFVAVYRDSGSTINTTQNDTTAFGVWTHIVQVIDLAVNLQKLYVNGTLNSWSAIIAKDCANATDMTIGKSQTTGASTAQPANADIEDVRFFTRALTTEDIEELYNQGLGSTALGLFHGESIYTIKSSKAIKSIGENNSSGRFELILNNNAGVFSDTFSNGDTIKIYLKKDSTAFSSNDIVFSGVTEDIDYQGEGSTKDRLVLSGSQYTARLMDVTITPVIYNNTDYSNIVIDIIQNNLPEITTNNVVISGAIKTQVNFNHTSIFDAFKQLAKEINYTFYVDDDLDLHFEPKSSTSSGYILDTENISSSPQILKSSFKTTTKGDFANSIWIYGDRILTGWKNNFTANGGSVFTLDYKPHNTKVYVGGSISPKIGGIYELTSSVGSPTQYLVNYDQKNIIFVSGTSTGDNIPISGIDAISIEYDRQTPIVKFGQDNFSIDTYKKKQKIIFDRNIKSPTDANDRLIAELTERSSPIIQGTISLHGVAKLNAGNTIIINSPIQKISNQTMDILEVNYDITPENLRSENIISSRLNKRIIDITDTLKSLAIEIKDLQLKESLSAGDIYPRVEFSTGSIGIKVKNWVAYKKDINDSFILGHPYNGVLGQKSGSGTQITTNSGSISWESGAPLIGSFGIGSSLLFNTIGSMGNNQLTIGSTQPVTFGCWVKPTINGMASANSQRIMQYNYCRLYIRETTNLPRLRYDYSAAAEMSGATLTGSRDWNFIAGYYNGGSMLRLYVNGSDIGSNTFVSGPTILSDGVSGLWLGPVSSTGSFGGYIKNPFVYHRLLSNAELGSIYSSQWYPPGSLMYAYLLNEGSGNKAFSSTLLGSINVQTFLGDRRGPLTFYQSGGEI